MNYIYVDIDGPVVRVYDANGDMNQVTFVASREHAEYSNDVICRGRADAIHSAELLAKGWAQELGCDYGSNEVRA